jgi:hypothetical protein
MSLALIGNGEPMHPLLVRVANDERVSVASVTIAQALLGTTPWGAAWQAVGACLPINSLEVECFHRIIDSVNSPTRLAGALLAYIRHLATVEHETACALYFAELARSFTEEPSPDLLIELATLYRKQARFIESQDVWYEVERFGRQTETPWLVVRAHIGLGMVTSKLGNLSKARTYFESAAADSYHLSELRAMALNNLGDVLSHMHPPLWVDAALKFYDAAHLHTDKTLQWDCFANLAICAVGCQHYKLADAALRLVIGSPLSPGSECWATVTNALIERLDTCSALQDWAQVEYIKDTLQWRLNRFDVDMQCDYHYRLGLVELRRGENPASEWRQALDIAYDPGPGKGMLGEWVMRMEKLLAVHPSLPEPREEPRLEKVWVDLDIRAIQAGV